MSKFHAGQRVRIIWSMNWPELGGGQGTVIEKITPGTYDDPIWEYLVAPDCWGSERAPIRGLTGGIYFAPSGDQLEPLSDANDVISWDECIWHPETQEEPA